MAIPPHANPAERRAYQRGWLEGFNGRERRTTHIYPNAYNRGYWEGVADREANNDPPPTKGDK